MRSYPKPKTARAAVLADLLQGRKITHKEVLIEHGTSRLSGHIHVLRHAMGWPISCDDIIVPTSDGRQATIGEYSMLASAIHEAGEQGSQFIEAVRAARRRAA